MNPIDRLAMVVELLCIIGDAESANWLWQGVEAYIRNDTPLGESLGLSGKLGRSPRYAYLRRLRDEALREALDILGGNYSRLATEIANFETRVPAWVRHATTPPDDWPQERKAIHRANATGLQLPTSRKGLREALGWQWNPNLICSLPAVRRIV